MLSGQPDNLPLCGGYGAVLSVARDKVSRRVAADARAEGEGRARALLALNTCFGQALGSKFATLNCPVIIVSKSTSARFLAQMSLPHDSESNQRKGWAWALPWWGKAGGYGFKKVVLLVALLCCLTAMATGRVHAPSNAPFQATARAESLYTRTGLQTRLRPFELTRRQSVQHADTDPCDRPVHTPLHHCVLSFY